MMPRVVPGRVNVPPKGLPLFMGNPVGMEAGGASPLRGWGKTGVRRDLLRGSKKQEATREARGATTWSLPQRNGTVRRHPLCDNRVQSGQVVRIAEQ
ncbi:hypothetical protein XAP412_690018 [Xanthomonas phaseoli pv. phaseoli]|uniref:Uncharacterized protein n=1 Tax=Xanthomonas campestris pv. phaseoli TaxID=317013 RepID=A0AB38E3C7_XANCH|nr:hypothetical protein XAP6984_730018 [Xanthomonas phaseoli pv. phaseoli]SON88858.1 hypothetical protein XAP412_690018 [Xanthomonas phaseoli pv. phaseoli]SON92052.1 hypothetical protein XAP7430_690018 [Xanthomonas phaseoli pv. phaseoli]SOO28929.1 hypothetical protein XAP6164_2910004 [Xanthomonas phaseoli pv. phaseoli]